MAPKGTSRPNLVPLAYLTHEIAFSPATVSVRNLSCTSSAALDAWGRPGKSQPLLVSASVSFRQPFATASASDSVTGGDTVHYGEMSKEILAAVKRGTDSSLSAQLGTACAVLTGKREGSKVLMDKTKVKAFDVRLLLPKASLMGEGVSLRTLAVLGEEGRTERYGCVLKLHRLRVPVLVGVNANERERKQIVVADVEIDQWDHKHDVYTELEEIVVKACHANLYSNRCIQELIANRLSVSRSWRAPNSRPSKRSPRCLRTPSWPSSARKASGGSRARTGGS